MKTCWMCHNEKDLSQFPKNKSRKGGVGHTCLLCQRILRKEHYRKNKEKTLIRNKNRRLKYREFIIEQKRGKKCSICGDARWWVLDFHHRDNSQKIESIGRMCVNYGMDNIIKEINKCDIICANCHRDLHYKENGGIV